MLQTSELSPIGLGTYGIGGRGHRDMELTELQEDQKYVDAIAYPLSKGINFLEISAGYGHGSALKLLTEGLRLSSVKREDLFITNSLYPRDLDDLATINTDIETFYETLATDYADSTLVTLSLIAKFGEREVFALLNRLLSENRTRYVSISNSSPDGIKKFKTEFGDKVFAHEGHLSFEVRALQDKGIFELCDELKIKNVIWRPLRRNMSAAFGWELLKELSEKYGKTQNQIILNWITHLGFYPMVMSTSIKHIDENLAAYEFEMSREDYQRIDDFRPPNYNPPKVDWDKTGDGDSIVTLVNEFEKHVNI